MGKIIAKGEHLGIPVTVTCRNEGTEIFAKFNDEINELYEGYFFDRMNECHVMPGNYVPERDSMLNALNVCQHYFFDNKPVITVEGDIGKLPYEPDIIY